MNKSPSAFDLLLGVEVRAARIEAVLLSDPIIAAQWRAEAAITESIASIGLEDVRISEGDLLMRIAENHLGAAESRAVEDALGVLRFLRAPGDMSRDPVLSLQRIARLAAPVEGTASSADLIWTDHGGEEEIAKCLTGPASGSPILDALRASATYALMTGRRSPVAERMVFTLVEHAARLGGRAQGKALRVEDPLRGLGGRIDAAWVAMPASALVRRQFRIWSPSSAKGVRDILEGISGHLDQEIGRVIGIRAWREAILTAGRGRHGRSRLMDAGAAFGEEPVMTSAVLADRLSITQRGAINLMGELVAAGLIREMTLRRTARIWGTPGLAERLTGKRTTGAAPRVRAVEKAPSRPNKPSSAEEATLHQRNLREENETSVARAMADFDAVMREADEILSRYKRTP